MSRVLFNHCQLTVSTKYFYQTSIVVLLNNFLAQPDSIETLSQIFGDSFDVAQGQNSLELVINDLMKYRL